MCNILIGYSARPRNTDYALNFYHILLTIEKPLDSKSGLEYVAFVEGTDELAAKFVSVVAITLANTKQYFDEKYDKNNFVKNVILDNILPGDIYIKSKELHFETDAFRVAMLIRLSDKSDVSAFDILQNLFFISLVDFLKRYY